MVIRSTTNQIIPTETHLGEDMKLGENNFLMKELFSATFLLAVLTGLFYILGSSYRAGYFKKWGIESQFVSTDFYTQIHFGSIVFHAESLLFLGLLISFYIVLTVLLYTAIDLSREPFIHKVAGFLWRKMLLLHKKFCNKKQKEKKENESVFLKELFDITLRLLVIASVIFLILYSFHKLIDFSSDMGANIAIKQYKSYSKKTSLNNYNGYFSEVKRYRIDGKVREAYLLDTDRKSYMLYFPKTKTQEETVEVIAATRIAGIVAKKNLDQ